MSRRIRLFRRFMAEDESKTFERILNRNRRETQGTRPIKTEKAQRIAMSLHRRKT